MNKTICSIFVSEENFASIQLLLDELEKSYRQHQVFEVVFLGLEPKFQGRQPEFPFQLMSGKIDGSSLVNETLSCVRGKYVLFLDSSCLSFLSNLHFALDFAERNNSDLLYLEPEIPTSYLLNKKNELYLYLFSNALMQKQPETGKLIKISFLRKLNIVTEIKKEYNLLFYLKILCFCTRISLCCGANLFVQVNSIEAIPKKNRVKSMIAGMLLGTEDKGTFPPEGFRERMLELLASNGKVLEIEIATKDFERKNKRNEQSIRAKSVDTVGLYWWDHDFEGRKNVGDIFSKFVVEKLTGKTVLHVQSEEPNKLCAIGSIISNKNLKSGSIFWGSGLHDPRILFYPASRNIFTAVRGPITRSVLLGRGYECPEVYGDPALLLPRLYAPTVRKKYKLGLICHWRHKEQLSCVEDVRFIDILRSEAEQCSFIDDILQCEAVLSSSLHGIIIANAYGIPARWFVMEGNPLEGVPFLKFNDYFMSVNMPIQKPLVFSRGQLVDSSYEREICKTVDLVWNAEKLFGAFPDTSFFWK